MAVSNREGVDHGPSWVLKLACDFFATYQVMMRVMMSQNDRPDQKQQQPTVKRSSLDSAESQHITT
eukprot:3940865-Amphidinium_carterae.1